jgi:hypothetical protein
VPGTRNPLQLKSSLKQLLLLLLFIITAYTQGVPGGKDNTLEGVPYVKLYRYNPKHLYPKLNSYRDNGQRSLKL